MTDEEIANADRMDYYDEFSDWLMNNYGEQIWNSDSLGRLFEDGDKFEEFLRTRK